MSGQAVMSPNRDIGIVLRRDHGGSATIRVAETLERVWVSQAFLTASFDDEQRWIAVRQVRKSASAAMYADARNLENKINL